MIGRKQHPARSRMPIESPLSFRGACLGAGVVLASLWLSATPAVAQVEIGDGERSLKISGACIRISGGGQSLAVGACSKKGEDDGDAEVTGRAENTDPEPTDFEEKILEATSPEETTLTMEITESTSPEDATPGDNSMEATSPETTQSEQTASRPSDDHAPEPNEDVCPAPPKEGEATRATVDRTLDGDTLELEERIEGEGMESTKLVRLIGADSPELADENSGPEPYAEEAAAFTADELDGEEIWLVPGEEPFDAYGRMLAYVWASGSSGGGSSQPRLFNLALVEAGLAEVMTIAPNDQYTTCFQAASERAKENGVGLHSGQSGDGSANLEAGEMPDAPASTQYALEDDDSGETGDAGSENSVSEQYTLPDVEIETTLDTTTLIPETDIPETADEPEAAPTEELETTEMPEENSTVLEAPMPPPETFAGEAISDVPPDGSAPQPSAEPVIEEPATLSVEPTPGTDTPPTNASDHLTVLPDTGGSVPDRDSLARLFLGLGTMGLSVSMLVQLHARLEDCDSPSDRELEERENWREVEER